MNYSQSACMMGNLLQAISVNSLQRAQSRTFCYVKSIMSQNFISGWGFLWGLSCFHNFFDCLVWKRVWFYVLFPKIYIYLYKYIYIYITLRLQYVWTLNCMFTTVARYSKGECGNYVIKLFMPLDLALNLHRTALAFVCWWAERVLLSEGNYTSYQSSH